MAVRKESHFPLRGGLDLVSSPLTIDPGRAWAILNYTPVEAGYRRIPGYERFDGRPKPSDAEYAVIGRTLGASSVDATVGETVTGGTSNATGVVLAVDEVGDDTTEYVLGEVSGTFENGEALTQGMSMTDVGTTTSPARVSGASSIDDDLDFRDLAAAHRRSNITAVPGSGIVRGVWHYMNDVYAIRDNAGATAGVMHKATSAGWAAVSLGHRIAFDNGSVEPTTGETVTGGTSGATARLGAVVRTSGSWDGGDAAGTFWLTAVMDGTGPFQDNENLQQSISGTDTTVAVSAGAAVENTLPAGGRYEFVNHNFYGQAASEEMYGVNGVGQAFHFDGTQFVSISTGHATDAPTHLAIHRQHLLLAYPGGSIVISETGNPDGYSALEGAAEIACGQDINGLVQGVGEGNTLIVGEDRIQVLYGNDSSDFQLADHSHPQTGGVEWTVQSVGGPLYMDNRGVRSVTTTQAYGNFVIGTMTAEIQPWLDRQRDERNTAVGSMRVRSRDQYRLWLSSGIGICIYLGRGNPEIGFIDYGLDENDVRIFPRCSVSAEDSDRIESIYFGADNGFVYQAERGRSFDGREIEAYLRLPLNHVGMPTTNKRFFSADLHCDLNGRAQIELSAIFEDGTNPDQLLNSADIYGGGGLWDEALWSEFQWDSPLNGYHSFDLRGKGRNVSVLLLSQSAKETSHILNGVSLYWSPLKQRRH